jgi:hypothetical protein
MSILAETNNSTTMSYLPKIIEISEELVNILIEDQFFVDFEITDYAYAKKRFCDELTTKFIAGELDFEDGELFTDDELDAILKEIAAESVLRTLEKGGYINSYEDENVEETFFLTEKGKKEIERLKDVDDVNGLRVFINENED